MTNSLRQIADDLYETRTDSPFPGLTTHAYLWTRPEGNLLLYSPASDADFDAIDSLGGVAHQYLSHEDEAGPNLTAIKQRFGSQLHVPAAETATIGKHALIDVEIAAVRHIDDNGIDIIPTPGHSPGSTSYLVTGSAGQTYLFTGDTVFPSGNGRWATYVDKEGGDPGALTNSLKLLATLRPGLVISSAFGGPTAVEEVSAHDWSRHVTEALDTVA